MSDKKPDTPTFTSLNPETGVLEVRHAVTGDLLAMQSSMEENILCAKERKAHLVMVNGHEVLVEAGVALNSIPKYAQKNGGIKTQWIYSTLIGESICQLVVEGYSMSKISKTPGFPPVHVMARWRKQNSSFKKMLEDAYRDRGEFHRDRVLDLIEEDPIIYDGNGKPIITEHGEVVMKDHGYVKMQVEGHKWLAGTDNVERFGNRTKVDQEVNVKHTVFMIDTGIRRPGDIGYNKDQVRIVQEEETKKAKLQEGTRDNGSRAKASQIIEVIGRQTTDHGEDRLPSKPKVE